MDNSTDIEALRRENADLRKMNDMKSDWISISAHQLRTSLSAVKWILKMFIDGDFGKLTNEQTGFIGKAFDSNERMITLVNELLSLNHTEQTSLTYNFQNHDIVALTDSVIFDFSGESYKKGVPVVFLKPTTPLPPCAFDEEKIRVVIQNLIENAIKYSNHGDKVIISITPSPTAIEISVKDSGIGIPAAEQDKILSKFFRATNAKAHDPIGSGLGLYTTKSIVERHGGKLSFESEENSGTTFHFTLPLQRSGDGAAA